MYYMCRKVKIGSGRPGHILLGSNGSTLICIRSHMLIIAKDPKLSNELSMLNSDDRSVSPEDI